MVSLLCQTFRHSNQTLTNTTLNIPFCDPQSPSASMEHSSRQAVGGKCWAELLALLPDFGCFLASSSEGDGSSVGEALCSYAFQ